MVGRERGEGEEGGGEGCLREEGSPRSTKNEQKENLFAQLVRKFSYGLYCFLA